MSPSNNPNRRKRPILGLKLKRQEEAAKALQERLQVPEPDPEPDPEPARWNLGTDEPD